MRVPYGSAMFVLLALTLPSWGAEPATHAVKQNKAAEGKKLKSQGPPCFCVREMLQDRPAPYPDVFSCIDYVATGGASCTDPEDDMWVGVPEHALPQHCERDECEPCDSCKDTKDSKDKNKKEAKELRTPMSVEGHGEHLTEAIAWGQFRARLQSAKDYYGSQAEVQRRTSPKYYLLLKSKYSQLNGDVIVMLVPLRVPDAKHPGNKKPFYFGMELDSATTTEWPNVADITAVEGKLLVTCKIDGEDRTAIVWLKDPARTHGR